MARGIRAGRVRRFAAVAAAVLAMAGLSASAGGVAPASAAVSAAPAAAVEQGWYMLVNDYYDGGSGVDGGVMWCLSTNAQTSPSGANTHRVYLARCNPGTAAQWWYLHAPSQWPLTVKNYQNFGGKIWELSATSTGAFTAQRSDAETHRWLIRRGSATNEHYFVNAALNARELSASHNNPDLPGTMNVYMAGVSGAPAHVWRYYQPAGRPACSPCGG